ncbi:TetR/AcrR family transcriptional regulator [Rubrobacter calidifluminis]|uniref:TetR/AcrR family transcriptional regulator n=1 Tax=Rubrobacter calidifluminis TaxID=1392640 RepID=UPI003B59CDDF
MSAVAKAAGVGQGSLYRHFPDRIELALAAFEDNVAELERLASDPAVTLGELLECITDRSIESVAFIDMIAPTTDDERLTAVTDRVIQALAAKVQPAIERGEVASDTTAEDLFLSVAMIATLVARTPLEQRRQVADRAWSLVRKGLV